MKKILILIALALPMMLTAQVNTKESCTSIMVGKRATTDGSVITSHTCDGRYRTWMSIEPAQKPGKYTLPVRKGTMHTAFRDDTTGVRTVGTIRHSGATYAYLNTAYPCLNDHQLAIGESTFSGPDTLVNPDGWFQIEELERLALMCCTTARDAIHFIAQLAEVRGYGDGGECITIADRKEVWQMEILGCGKDQIGAVWAAQRVPDDHVAVSCNIPRIGRLQRNNPEYFMCSDNIEEVAKRYGLWDGEGEFIFWRAFNTPWAKGKNFREREFFIFSTLAPSQNFTRDMDELPFSIKPDEKVSVRQVMELLRSTYEGTDMDMTRNLRIVNRDGDTVISPVANPWLTSAMQNTFNLLAPGTIEFQRTVSVAWCSYSFVAQLRDWLPDAVGGVCWMSVDNPGQSPRIPIFCGNTELPEAFGLCGHKGYNENAVLWQFRKANKLATVQWQRTKKQHINEVLRLEDEAFDGLTKLENKVIYSKKIQQRTKLLIGYTQRIYGNATGQWRRLEEEYWQMFGMGF